MVNDTIIKQSNTFDESKRCTKYTEFPSQSNEKVHTFAYDGEGNLTEHVFGSHSAEYEYDKYNRTTKTDYWFTSTDGHNYTYKYKDGLKNELEEVNGFGLVQTFAHDKLGRQTESKIEGIYSKKATYLKYGDHTTDRTQGTVPCVLVLILRVTIDINNYNGEYCFYSAHHLFCPVC